MKIPEKFIDKYFLEQYLIKNWDYILKLIASDNYINGSDISDQIYEEFKKYKLLYATLEENDEE